MPLLSKDLLKTFFESGDRPTSAQFASLIDSMMHLYDDRHRIGLRVYDATRSYIPGDTTLFDNSLFVCTTETTGNFQPAHWQPVMSAGAVTYMGTWNAQTNTPSLTSNTGVKGQYYVVTVSGSTSINGISDWQVGDWIIYNGSQWQKVDNTDSGASLTAAQVVFTPTGVITETNVQAALAQLLTWTTTQLAGKTDAFSGTTGNVVSFDVQQRPVDSGLSLNLVPRLSGGTATSGNFISGMGGNQVQDSGVNAGSFMLSSATASDIPATAMSPLSATNVQGLFDEVGGLLLPKVTGAVSGNIPLLTSVGTLSDSGKKPADYIAFNNTTAFTPSADFHPATKRYVDEKARNRVMIPFMTTGAGTSVTTTSWARFGVFVLGDHADMYPEATSVGIRVRFAYRLAASTTGDFALSLDTAVTPATFVSQTLTSLSVVTPVTRTNLTEEFVISNNANTLISIIGRKPTGTGTLAIHGATLFLRFF
ncbi:MAG: hypothetical protein IM638_12735 [Bacteroidetes bacterium]|nr:hypothetical protein [Bacteroidota bacterium]